LPIASSLQLMASPLTSSLHQETQTKNPKSLSKGIRCPSVQLQEELQEVERTNTHHAQESQASLSDKIASLQSISEAEALLRLHGRHFRPSNVAELLIRLPTLIEMKQKPIMSTERHQSPSPSLDRDERSRVEKMASLLAQASARSASELSGPVLTGCIWSLGRLSLRQGSVPCRG